ncbi:cuticle protein CP14.6-like [Uranotaenia lowii]|uniref:cuticle protein CP14.6-like n=1 Tax=Uranotaenia lowii TaxID=190385 RepID=UPI002479D66E|nr:cuticle protein CP14.6-like [Uranotaenia lowii]
MIQKTGIILLIASCTLAIPQRYYQQNAAPLQRRAASPGGPDADATVITQEQQINPDGSYSHVFETSNGIRAAASSQDGVAATGEFSYTAPEGDRIQVTYVADQGGFQPQGSHLPVEPAVPDHVIKSLEEIRANPPNDPNYNAAFLDAVLARLRGLQG